MHKVTTQSQPQPSSGIPLTRLQAQSKRDGGVEEGGDDANEGHPPGRLEVGDEEDTIWTAPKMTVMIQDYMSVR